VTGKWGDIDGVWIDPVTAQEMMILRDAMTFSPMMALSAMAPTRTGKYRCVAVPSPSGLRARWLFVEAPSRSVFLFEHDLRASVGGKPPYFCDSALA
jgi:hypothetical protein